MASPSSARPVLSIITVESHGAAVEACAKIGLLCDHAVARGYFHPGIDKYRHLMTLMPPAPHAERFNAAVKELSFMDVKNEGKMKEWKDRFGPVFKGMKTCEERLKGILEEEDIKAFMAGEKELVTEEKEI